MRNKVILFMFGLSMLSFSAKVAPVNASVNLIETIQIDVNSNTTAKTITDTYTGLVEFPQVDLLTKGKPGSSIELITMQNLELTGTLGDTVQLFVTFDAGTVTTDGTNAKTVQIIDSTGSIGNALKLSTNLSTSLTADVYTGTANITAAYN